MDAHIVSLDEYRRRKEHTQPNLDQSFTQLFEHAQELRHGGSEVAPNTIAIMNHDDLRTWFQNELANEVFRQRMFSKPVLQSICYVAELFASYMRVSDDTHIALDHVFDFIDSQNADAILEAANTAFMVYVLGPEARVRRSTKYRKFALHFGPSLYMTYAGLAQKHFGYYMAEAFEPLGTIARDRFHTM